MPTVRQQQVLNEVRNSPTYAEAGRRLGLTRARVSKIAAKHRAKCGVPGYQLLSDYALEHGYRQVSTVLRQIKQLQLPGVKVTGYWLIPISGTRKCSCGRPVLKYTRVCSQCRQERRRNYEQEYYGLKREKPKPKTAGAILK